LGVRLLCSTGEEDDINLEQQTAQASAIVAKYHLTASVLPIKSVGVKADIRCYEHPVMFNGSANWKQLIETSGSVLKSVEGINRCLWNLNPNSNPRSFRPIKSHLTKKRLDLLREADFLVMDCLRRYGIYQRIWQCPTVLVPLRIDGKGEELCIIRPVLSERAMTAAAAELPPDLLNELRESILGLPGISGLALDLTSKPPGTIEWE
jgi:GMP synthase (glutamine-hydrolysing)